MAKQAPFAVLSRAEAIAAILRGDAVDGGPGQPGPLYARDFARLIAGGIVIEMAAQIKEARSAQKTRELGQTLVRQSATELVGYNGEGPTWLDLPFPFPWPPRKFGSDWSIFETLKPGALDGAFATLAQRLAELAAAPR